MSFHPEQRICVPCVCRTNTVSRGHNEKNAKMESDPFTLVLSAIKKNITQWSIEASFSVTEHGCIPWLIGNWSQIQTPPKDMSAYGTDGLNHDTNLVILNFSEGVCEKQPGQPLNSHSHQERVEQLLSAYGTICGTLCICKDNGIFYIRY